MGLLPAGLVAQTQRFRPSPIYVGNGKADQTEGRRVLDQFRQMGIAGAYWLEFDLRVMPRRGDERTVRGQLFGARNDAGPITRLTLPGQQGLTSEHRWLIQSGAQAAGWAWSAGATRELTVADTFQSIGGTDLTLFDLQMPFLYWSDLVYEGLAKVRGRPAHSFLLYPPAELAVQRPQLAGVRVFLDTQFGALVQAELLGAKSVAEKTITVLDLKKVGEQWIVREIDLRNAISRDKTRFTVRSAAFNLLLPPATFLPAGLAQEVPPILEAKIEHL